MKNDFLRSIMVLLTGSVAAQLLSVITTPVKTRLFTVEDIGLVTYYMTIVGIFSPAITGQYDAIIVMAKKHIYGVIKLCMCVCLITTIVFTTGVLFYYLYFGSFCDNIALIIYMPICLIITGLSSILGAYNNRCREYNLFAKINVIRAMANLLGTILLGLLETGYIGLLVISILSQLVAIRKQARSLKKYLRKIYNVKTKLLIIIAKKYWQQPLVSMPGTFINSLSYSLLAICIRDIYDNLAILGYYSMSMAILGLPLSIVSSNVGKVFFEEAVREKENKGNFSKSFLKTTKYLLTGTIPVFVIVYFLSPWGCQVFLGSNWEVTGIYIQCLVPMFAIRFIVAPLTISILISQRQYYNLIIQALFIISIISCYIITRNNCLDIEGFLSLVNWCYTLVYILFWEICRRLAKGDNKETKLR